MIVGGQEQSQALFDPTMHKTLAEIAKSAGKSIYTARRWIDVGCRGHMLKATYIGGRIFVHLADLHEFFERINERRQPSAPKGPTPAQRQREKDTAADRVANW